MKRLVAVLLVMVSLMTVFPAAQAVTPTFPDIKDARVAREVATLQMLGVIEGDGGMYRPEGTLTRAAFCKMAVVIMDEADKEPQYRSRTIFPDVRANHWGRGYINLAANLTVSGGERIIAGGSDGLFRPDDDITYAQAITILMRILGYTAADAGMLWPAGYLELADTAELTMGVTVKANEPVSRAMAARLFFNLLSTKTRVDGKEGGRYIETLGKAANDVIIMDLNATMEDGTPGCVMTSVAPDDVRKAKRGIVPESFLGLRGTLLTDSAGEILTFLPGDDRSVVFTASSANAAWIKSVSGTQYDIPSKTKVHTPDGESTLGEMFFDITSGTQVTIFYKSDAIDVLYANVKPADSAFIVPTDSVSRTAFNALTGGVSGYKIIKNGAEAYLADIRKYDVVTYDSGSKTLRVSDFRITASYEYARPNIESPATITLIGRDFDVLASATGLAELKIGDAATFVFTADYQIAGVFPADEIHASPLGVVENDPGAGIVTVRMLNGLELKGNPHLTADAAARLGGELVTVSSSRPGDIVLTKILRSDASGGLDLDTLAIGQTPLASGVKIFERVGKSALREIGVSDISQSKVPQSKIIYNKTNTGGRVDLVILNDVTGDLYSYGFMKLEQRPAEMREETVLDENGNPVKITVPANYVHMVKLENKINGVIGPVDTSIDFEHGALGGIVLSADGTRVESIVKLTEASGIRRTAFYTIGGNTFVTVEGKEIPVAGDVQCYNKTTGRWFDSLAEARSFSSGLTVYYDRPPEDGGKVRVIFGE